METLSEEIILATSDYLSSIDVMMLRHVNRFYCKLLNQRNKKIYK